MCFNGAPVEDLMCIEYEKGMCGIHPHESNVGASHTNEPIWPWEVSLWNWNSSYNQFCAGVLIGDNWVLTAAHCVYKLNIMDVIVGLYVPRERRIRIKNIFVHPKFQSEGIFSYDVALVQVEYDAHYYYYIPRICLPSFDDVYPPNSCYMTGWGEKRDRGNRSRLRVLNVTRLDPEFCKNIGSGEIRPKLHICVNYGLKGYCRGGSGGPLTCVRSSDGRFVVAGVASWGDDSCEDKYYASYYTNIKTFVPWINNILNSNKEKP